MKLSQTLESQDLTLEPLNQSHSAETCFAWLQNEDINRHLNLPSFKTSKDLSDHFKSFSQNGQVFAIMAGTPRQYVGNVLFTVRPENKSAEINLFIGDRNLWNKGLATGAFQLLLDFASQKLGLHRITATIVSGQSPMVRIFQKLGFSREGTLRESFFKNGAFYDTEIWACLLSVTDAAQNASFFDSKKPDYGKPMFAEKLRYCVRCCMPETNEGIKFDEMGICQACYSAEQKMHIDWVVREKELRRLLDEYKSKAGNNYDCLVPISGGKDSCFQLHVLTKIYGMKPLAVTFNHNWYTETGKYNLWNILEKLGIDHVMFTPNRPLINKLAKQSLYKIGDSCWHCHMGVGAFPLQAAVMFKIPLLVWGESIAEASGRANYKEIVKFDANYFLNVSAKVPPSGMVGNGITPQDVKPFQNPETSDMEKLGLVGIHLGDYIFWDHERQVEFLKKAYDWREDRVEGTYKRYKSVECVMSGVHDYAKFIKRGFGRGTDHASQDLRAGLLTREEAFELAKKYDSERPQALDYYLKITGLTEAEFEKTLKDLRPGKAKELPK